MTIGLAAPKAKAGFVVGFGDSAAGGISESVGLITESIGLLLGVGLSLGASFAAGADLTVATDAAANSNVGSSALASFSRWPSGFAEPRGVAFGSANVNAPPASSADFFSLLGRDLREDATVFGRVKLSSDFVGDVDHFCTDLEALLGLGVLLGLDALLGFDALLGLSASNFASGPFLEEPGLNMEPAGIAIDPAVFSADDLRGSLVLPIELSEKTGGPSSFAWLAREAAAGVAAVPGAGKKELLPDPPPPVSAKKLLAGGGWTRTTANSEPHQHFRPPPNHHLPEHMSYAEFSRRFVDHNMTIHDPTSEDYRPFALPPPSIRQGVDPREVFDRCAAPPRSPLSNDLSTLYGSCG